MGLFSLFSGKPKDGVRGTAQVISSTAHGGRATHQTCRLNLVVQVEGMQPYSVEHSQICPASKWPHPGETVPVIVSRKKPTKLKIDFDAMPDDNDVARRRAEQHAAMLRGETTPGATVAGSPQVTFVGGTAADIPPEMRAGLEQMLGVDLDGDGRVGGAPGAAAGTPTPTPPPPPPPAPGRPDDRLAQLERLAQLRDSGALTQVEFEAEKRRLLGS